MKGGLKDGSAMNELTAADASGRRPLWRDLAIAVVPVVAASVIGGAVTAPQIAGWYAGLLKPPFNPPNWVFGPAWTVLFALMALAVFRILRLPPATPGRSAALVTYHLQLVLNVLWSCAFFGLRSPLAGLVVILPLLALILLTIRRFGRLDRTAGLLLWPYPAWVGYATLLNLSIWWLNR
jgi:tryptophan-rich sensory protein